MSDETRLNMRHTMARTAALLRTIGPYAVIELILPGGSLIALLLWLCRRNEVVSSVVCACGAAITHCVRSVLPAGGRPLGGAVWASALGSRRLQGEATRSPACA